MGFKKHFLHFLVAFLFIGLPACGGGGGGTTSENDGGTTTTTDTSGNTDTSTTSGEEIVNSGDSILNYKGAGDAPHLIF